MPYIGKNPVGGGFHKLDALTASATATYALTLGGAAYYPETANQLLVSLNGVIQAPQDSFTVSGSNIVFDSALTASDSIDFIVALGDVLGVQGVTDGTVTTAKIANQAVTADKLANTLDLSSKTVTLPSGSGGKVLKMEISEITANSTRASASSYADDLDFGSFTPSSTNSTIFIQGVANMDSPSNTYLNYKWVINGTDYVSSGAASPLRTHTFYSSTSLNDAGYMPSTIMTSITNTTGNAITVVCQGALSSASTLYINRSVSGTASGSPSSVIFTEVSN